ncbi:hypothetical protein JCGZ_23188 [Jatropha curcas]|uniref:Uncharacterized protein n=1 Tax=Jatropha curcas TaxID=180498 RepID=A0A067JTM9_JATCU|nr:hypothetical protein JCGZ_23188 [Jatropha curcas]
MEEQRKKKQSIPAAEQHGQEQEVYDDDEKVEKFFSIIRRLRDSRHCSTNSLRELEARKKTRMVKKVNLLPEWTPFQMEDFAGINPSSSSNKEEGEDEKEKKEALDLNLAL